MDNKLYVVSVINFFDNNLVTEFTKGKNWYEALHNHSKMLGDQWLDDEDIEYAKYQAFNSNMMFEVKELELQSEIIKLLKYSLYFPNPIEYKYLSRIEKTIITEEEHKKLIEYIDKNED